MPENIELNKHRLRLLHRLECLLEGPMVFLGFIWLGLLIIELIWGLSPVLQFMSTGIWIVFIIDFLTKFTLAPHKIKFLRKNWLTAISLIIPALRIVRIVRFARLLRGLRGVRLVKIIASLNRGMRSLGATMRRRGVAYVLALTLVVIFAGAAGMYAFENNVENGFKSYWESLWWTAMLLTSLGSEYWPQTAEGRALCFLLSLYGFSIFGYITATLASFFVGREAEEKEAPIASSEDVKALQTQVQKLSQTIIDLRNSVERNAK